MLLKLHYAELCSQDWICRELGEDLRVARQGAVLDILEVFDSPEMRAVWSKWSVNSSRCVWEDGKFIDEIEGE